MDFVKRTLATAATLAACAALTSCASGVPIRVVYRLSSSDNVFTDVEFRTGDGKETLWEDGASDPREPGTHFSEETVLRGGGAKIEATMTFEEPEDPGKNLWGDPIPKSQPINPTCTISVIGPYGETEEIIKEEADVSDDKISCEASWRDIVKAREDIGAISGLG